LADYFHRFVQLPLLKLFAGDAGTFFNFRAQLGLKTNEKLLISGLSD
jgi:hypothetical protein